MRHVAHRRRPEISRPDIRNPVKRASREQKLANRCSSPYQRSLIRRPSAFRSFKQPLAKGASVRCCTRGGPKWNAPSGTRKGDVILGIVGVRYWAGDRAWDGGNMDGRAWKKATSGDERVLCIALSACIVRYKSPRMLRGENKYSGANRIVIRQFQFQTARTLLLLTLITLTGTITA